MYIVHLFVNRVITSQHKQNTRSNRTGSIIKIVNPNQHHLLLFIPHSLDWLAAFHLDLLQATLFVAVQLSAPVFLATCFKYRSRGLPTAFFSEYCYFKDIYHKLVMPNCMPCPRVVSIFFNMFKSNLSSFTL